MSDFGELTKDGRRQAIRYTWSKWWTGTYFVYDRHERITEEDDEIQCDYEVIITFKTKKETEEYVAMLHSKFGYYGKIK